MEARPPTAVTLPAPHLASGLQAHDLQGGWNDHSLPLWKGNERSDTKETHLN